MLRLLRVGLKSKARPRPRVQNQEEVYSPKELPADSIIANQLPVQSAQQIRVNEEVLKGIQAGKSPYNIYKQLVDQKQQVAQFSEKESQNAQFQETKSIYKQRQLIHMIEQVIQRRPLRKQTYDQFLTKYRRVPTQDQQKALEVDKVAKTAMMISNSKLEPTQQNEYYYEKVLQIDPKMKQLALKQLQSQTQVFRKYLKFDPFEHHRTLLKNQFLEQKEAHEQKAKFESPLSNLQSKEISQRGKLTESELREKLKEQLKKGLTRSPQEEKKADLDRRDSLNALSQDLYIRTDKKAASQIQANLQDTSHGIASANRLSLHNLMQKHGLDFSKNSFDIDQVVKQDIFNKKKVAEQQQQFQLYQARRERVQKFRKIKQSMEKQSLNPKIQYTDPQFINAFDLKAKEKKWMLKFFPDMEKVQNINKQYRRSIAQADDSPQINQKKATLNVSNAIESIFSRKAIKALFSDIIIVEVVPNESATIFNVFWAFPWDLNEYYQPSQTSRARVDSIKKRLDKSAKYISGQVCVELQLKRGPQIRFRHSQTTQQIAKRKDQTQRLVDQYTKQEVQEKANIGQEAMSQEEVQQMKQRVRQKVEVKMENVFSHEQQLVSEYRESNCVTRESSEQGKEGEEEQVCSLLGPAEMMWVTVQMFLRVRRIGVRSEQSTCCCETGSLRYLNLSGFQSQERSFLLCEEQVRARLYCLPVLYIKFIYYSQSALQSVVVLPPAKHLSLSLADEQVGPLSLRLALLQQSSQACSLFFSEEQLIAAVIQLETGLLEQKLDLLVLNFNQPEFLKVGLESILQLVAMLFKGSQCLFKLHALVFICPLLVPLY